MKTRKVWILALAVIGIGCLAACQLAAVPAVLASPPAVGVPTETLAPAATSLPAETYTPIPTATPGPALAGPPQPANAPLSGPTDTPAPTPADPPTPAPTDSPTPVATLKPGGRVGLGAYLDGTPYDSFAAVQRFEALLKHKMQYALWFQAWGNEDRAFPSSWVALAAQKGLVPAITWEPWQRDFTNPTAVQPAYSLGSIVSGAHDEYIRSWAQGAKAAGVPMVIRFAQEQSTEPGTRQWYPWQGDPEGYKAAFRHIVTIFRGEGANNVQFLWSAMWLDQWAPQYYPGDDVVDMVGTTVLNHGTVPSVVWAKWRTFDDFFAGQYQSALRWNKPIVLTELASAEQGGDKAAWLRDCLTSLKPKYPLVQGVLLLEVPSDREWPAINWSVASSPASLAAFETAIGDAYFK